MIQKKITSIIFLVFLALGLTSLIFMPKKTFSENENRFLADMPKVTLYNVFNGDRRFMNGFETYVSDHFSFREFWISAKTNFELLSGKKESNGVFILKNSLMKKIEKSDPEVMNKNIAAILNFENSTGLPCFFLLVPTAAGIYPERLPDNTEVLDQNSILESCVSQFDGKIECLDAFSPLVSAKDEYIYYRTDHHWTSLGAYLVYEKYIENLGFESVPLKDLTTEKAADDFLGTLYSKTLYNRVSPDAIDFYYPVDDPIESITIQAGTTETKYDSIYFREYLEKKDKYAAFLGSNQPMVTIKTKHNEGPKLLVFKDSYAQTMVQFLSLHYSEIVYIDLRYINKPIGEILDLKQYNQVLFLYNIENFVTDESIYKLNND